MFLLPDDAWEMRYRPYGRDDDGRRNRGVFARRAIPAGTLIGDYLGLLIPREEEAAYETGSDVYLMYYDEQLSIWPDPTVPGVHIVNHACEPNVGIYPYRGHGLYHALRRIHAGEELTVSYLLGPIDDECSPCLHACHCRARACTGTMHVSYERYAAWNSFDRAESRKSQQEPGAALAMLSALDRYPARIADHRFYSLYGAPEPAPHVLNDAGFPSLARLRRAIRRTGRRIFLPVHGVTVLGVDGTTVLLEGA
jgi:hypothetical protein